MGPAMECLMAAESIRGFAEALVLAEVSVEAGVAVGAEAGEFGSRFKLALNCRKEAYYAERRRNRAGRAGTWCRSRYGQGSRPGQRSNGWPICRGAGRKLCLPEMWHGGATRCRPAL